MCTKRICENKINELRLSIKGNDAWLQDLWGPIKVQFNSTILPSSFSSVDDIDLRGLYRFLPRITWFLIIL